MLFIEEIITDTVSLKVPECLGAALEHLKVFNDRAPASWLNHLCLSEETREFGSNSSPFEYFQTTNIGINNLKFKMAYLMSNSQLFGSHLGFFFNGMCAVLSPERGGVAEKMQADVHLLNFRMFYAHFSL